MATATRKSTERHCNMTLTREEWAVFVSILDRVRDPIAAQAKIGIADAIREADGAASISIDRDCERWGAVHNLAYRESERSRRKAEMDVCYRMTIQLSEARFTKDF
jgi:hypothetical protein